YKPSQATREGSMVPPTLKITMSNGLVVERKGKNASLKVIDPNGQKGGQQLLDSFVEELAINLPKFMDGTPKEKADVLLKIIGVGDQLAELELKEKEIYNQRHAIGVIADQKEKFAKEMTYYPDAPNQLVSISELIQQQQAILAKNGGNARKRQNVERIRYDYDQSILEVDRLRKLLADAEAKTNKLSEDLKIANTDAMDLHDESTAEIEANIADIDEVNRKVRANFDKNKAEEDAKQQREQYNTLTNEIEVIRQQKRDLLTNADLPLPGLSVADGKLLYLGQEWDNMSGSQQLMVATAIVRKLKPDCGFVLIDKLEQMDNITLKQFGAWLDREGLQAIATRVSTGEECAIIIEDGYSVENEAHSFETAAAGNFAETVAPTWQSGF
ncbi:TPA: chromosome segregation protein SMC, partial [Streptococcus equi subsp. equi]|nr:chromosome segregation protein SMC [Streptococcus equi subsp. equi]